MRKRRKNQGGDYNYWQPATDMMAGLVFVLMLIVALLGLYLLSDYSGYKYEETQASQESESAGETVGETAPPEDGWSWKEDKGDGAQEEEGAGSGDGDGTGEGEQPIVPTGGGGYGDEGIKSAVFAELIDDETSRIIPDQGVKFELYKTDGALQNPALQILNTYYPEKIAYREFETTEEGTFYLPEKIYQGNYYFHELDEPEGYDAAADTYFNLDQLYDWPNPYVVQLRVSPSKNIIRVQMNDSETGEPVSGGTFRVCAAEDISTLDGTVRYTEGQLVDTIACDENGYGESSELYLGRYTLEQAIIPSYYAGVSEKEEAQVEKKKDEDPDLHEIKTEKTKIMIRLTDELYLEQPLSSAVFAVTNQTTGAAWTVETDESGQAVLSDLDKNTEYEIREQQTEEGYHLDTEPHSVKVDASGRIDGENQAELALTNRIYRVSVHAADAILRNDVPNVTFSLYDDQDKLIRSWVSGDSGEEFTDLTEGSYYVIRGENTDKKYEFVLKDTAAVQNWNISVVTLHGVMVLVIGGLAGIALLYLLVRLGKWLHWKRKERKKSQKEEKKELLKKTKKTKQKASEAESGNR